ncbi:hypothetical protein L596_025791 [Steinernema carpocapsae]|uniref:Uncharacterized protein n=1 Tax=Steinernema carpocapsae TaxID=34508 RepID=A0A4U5M8U8_STECR|nr:hypothetical protein L596_025791 [Steinernema carpocapsae]
MEARSPQTAKHSNLIEAVQKKFVKFVFMRCCGLSPNYSSTLQRLGVASLSHRRLIASLTFVYKLFRRKVICNLKSTPNPRLRSRAIFRIPPYHPYNRLF